MQEKRIHVWRLSVLLYLIFTLVAQDECKRGEFRLELLEWLLGFGNRQKSSSYPSFQLMMAREMAVSECLQHKPKDPSSRSTFVAGQPA